MIRPHVALTTPLVIAPGLRDEGECPELIARARLGDRAAFGEIYATYSRQVYLFILRRVTEPANAEDLMGETFTRAFAKIATYRWQGKPYLAWLYTIARNAVTDWHRRERPTWDLDEALTQVAGGKTAHELAVLGEETTKMQRALACLTDLQRSVVQLYFLDDLPHAQVASRLGKKPGAVRALQFRAIARLREELTLPTAA